MAYEPDQVVVLIGTDNRFLFHQQRRCIFLRKLLAEEVKELDLLTAMRQGRKPCRWRTCTESSHHWKKSTPWWDVPETSAVARDRGET